MTEEILVWIKQLIEENKVHEFYASSIWRKTQKDALKRQHYECQRCKRRGMVAKARTVHHKKYLRTHPELALDEDNLEAICDECHYDEHHRRKGGFVNEERW